MTLKSLRDWPKSRYDSRVDNVVTEFLIPALRHSTTYQRIGGFFSSTSLALSSRGIKELIQNDGKMQLIISPILDREDAAVLNSTSERRDKIIDKALSSHLDTEIEFEKNHVAALAYLLKKNQLEIKIDIPSDLNGNYLDYETIMEKNLLDEKLGIFQDRNGNAVSFRGSVNENRQSWERGIFSITVDVDWIEGQRAHVQDDVDRFDKKWNHPDLISLPQNTRQRIMVKVPESVDEIDLEKFNVPPWAKLPDGKMLWEHQIRAVNSWINAGYRGILSMATSGGKTLCALVSSSLVPSNSIVVILVPFKVLVEQWEREIRKFDPAADLVLCSSEHKTWDQILSGKLASYVKGTPDRSKQVVILSTMHTAASDRFQKHFDGVGKEWITVIADEVHHLGASTFSKVFSIESKHQLGLSATYTRDWDDVGTSKIKEYFGPELDAQYTIADGIGDRKLSRYEYHPFFAYMKKVEYDEYENFSDEIKRVYAMLESTKMYAKKQELEKKLFKLLLSRAEIIKKAEDKPNAYAKILQSSPPKPYIVFADDKVQIAELKKVHKSTIQEINKNKTTNIEKDDIMVFSGELDGAEQKKILEEAKTRGTPLFAMYCLDEGVDVPEFQSAILVSSSTSRRQYVQRRGRILRISKQKIAHLYDIIVIPNPDSYPTDLECAKSIVEKEEERVKILSRDAINKYDAMETFEKRIKSLGF